MSRKIVWLAISLIFLNLIDYVTTVTGLKLGLCELNPFYGADVWHVLKFLFPIWLGVLVIYVNHYALKQNSKIVQKTIFILMATLNLFYVLVVVNNIFWLWIIMNGMVL